MAAALNEIQWHTSFVITHWNRGATLNYSFGFLIFETSLSRSHLFGILIDLMTPANNSKSPDHHSEGPFFFPLCDKGADAWNFAIDTDGLIHQLKCVLETYVHHLLDQFGRHSF